MRKNKNYLLGFLVVIITIATSYGQYSCTTNDPAKGATPDEQALNTYWHYRYRLIHYFMRMGSKVGMSIPADVRNITDDYNGGTNAIGERIGWTDEGRLLGYYLATLATEYRLLANNHQNTDETLKELYFAVHAVFTTDSIFLARWHIYGSIDATFFNSFPATFPGFGILGLNTVGGKGKLLNTDPLNAGLGNPIISSSLPCTIPPPSSVYSLDYNYCPALPISTFGSGEVGPVDEISGDGAGPDGTVTSKDNFIAVLWGLAFVYKLVDDVHGFTGCSNPYGYNLSPKIMAQQLAIQIFNYMFNFSALLLKTPDGKLAEDSPSAGFDGHGSADEYFLWPYDVPLRDMANDIFNYPGFISIPAVPSVINTIAVDGGPVGYAALLLNKGVEWDNYTLCNAASDYFTSQISSGECNNTSVELGMLAASGSGDGGAYSSACDMINAFGTWNGNGCVCSGITQSTANVGWEQYWGAAYEILNGVQCSAANFCAMQQIIYSAPYHGPYCHYLAQTSSDLGRDDFASCDWAGTRRFGNPAIYAEYGNPGDAGNYNGLDYMLLYNMYCLLCYDRQRPIVHFLFDEIPLPQNFSK